MKKESNHESDSASEAPSIPETLTNDPLAIDELLSTLADWNEVLETETPNIIETLEL